MLSQAINPIPAVATFFREGKNKRGTKDQQLSREDYKTIAFILENSTYKGFSDLSLANLLQGIDYKKGTWKDLQSHQLTDSIIKVIILCRGLFQAPNIARILQSLSHLKMGKKNYVESGLEKFFSDLIKEKIEDFNCQDVSSIFFALVLLNYTWEELKKNGLDRLLIHALKKNVQKLSRQSAANLLWSLAHLGLTWEELEKEQLTKPFIDALEIFCHSMELGLLIQVRQAQLWFGFKLNPVTELYIDNILKQLPKPKSSEFHLKIARRLERLAALPIVNEKCFARVLWVDIVCAGKGFEVNGPCHEETDHLDRFKMKLLQKIKIPVSIISYKDNVTDDFLSNLLRENGIPLRSEKPKLICHPQHTLFAQQEMKPSNINTCSEHKKQIQEKTSNVNVSSNAHSPSSEGEVKDGNEKGKDHLCDIPLIGKIGKEEIDDIPDAMDTVNDTPQKLIPKKTKSKRKKNSNVTNKLESSVPVASQSPAIAQKCSSKTSCFKRWHLFAASVLITVTTLHVASKIGLNHKI